MSSPRGFVNPKKQMMKQQQRMAQQPNPYLLYQRQLAAHMQQQQQAFQAKLLKRHTRRETRQNFADIVLCIGTRNLFPIEHNVIAFLEEPDGRAIKHTETRSVVAGTGGNVDFDSTFLLKGDEVTHRCTTDQWLVVRFYSYKGTTPAWKHGSSRFDRDIKKRQYLGKARVPYRHILQDCNTARALATNVGSPAPSYYPIRNQDTIVMDAKLQKHDVMLKFTTWWKNPHGKFHQSLLPKGPPLQPPQPYQEGRDDPAHKLYALGKKDVIADYTTKPQFPNPPQGSPFYLPQDWPNKQEKYLASLMRSDLDVLVQRVQKLVDIHEPIPDEINAIRDKIDDLPDQIEVIVQLEEELKGLSDEHNCTRNDLAEITAELQLLSQEHQTVAEEAAQLKAVAEARAQEVDDDQIPVLAQKYKLLGMFKNNSNPRQRGQFEAELTMHEGKMYKLEVKREVGGPVIPIKDFEQKSAFAFTYTNVQGNYKYSFDLIGQHFKGRYARMDNDPSYGGSMNGSIKPPFPLETKFNARADNVLATKKKD